MSIPHAHFGEVNKIIDWRKLDKDDKPDDDEPTKTPNSVKALLKVDPEELFAPKNELKNASNYLVDGKEESEFVKPTNIFEEHNEVHHQLEAHKQNPFLPKWVHSHLKSLTSKPAWNNAIKTAKVKNVLPHEYPKMGNTEGSMTPINPIKRNRVAKQFNSKSKMTMPLVLHNTETNEKYSLAGHTRLAYNSLVNKKPTPALHLEYHPPKKQPKMKLSKMKSL
jgi:hypothetical protein